MWLLACAAVVENLVQYAFDILAPMRHNNLIIPKAFSKYHF